MDLKPAIVGKKSELSEPVRSYPMSVENPKFNPSGGDASTNDAMVTREQFFAQLRGALIAGLPEGSEKSSALTRLDVLEKAKGYTFLRYYSNFIAGVAHHMNVVCPFIHGLTSILVRV